VGRSDDCSLYDSLGPPAVRAPSSLPSLTTRRRWDDRLRHGTGKRRRVARISGQARDEQLPVDRSRFSGVRLLPSSTIAPPSEAELGSTS
jgi:hypothetical protein